LSRTHDGRQAAKARGVAFGRPQKMLRDQKELARELVREGKSAKADGNRHRWPIVIATPGRL
jgi:DNA invertase Pin-like site-specific DNA recombinase